MPQRVAAAPMQPKTQAEKEAQIRPFRLRQRSPDGQPVGKHIQIDPRVKRNQGESDESYRKRAETLYFPGDVVESTTDLASNMPEKFERADSYQDPNRVEMAPGELPEDFERRKARLLAQAGGQNLGGPVSSDGGQRQTDMDHRQGGDIPLDLVQGATKVGAHRLSHLKLEGMTQKQLQEIIDNEEIETGGKALTKTVDMVKVIRDWMATDK